MSDDCGVPVIWFAKATSKGFERDLNACTV